MGMKKKILVLGAGLVGKHIAVDLAKSFDVECADIIDHSKFFKNTGVKFRGVALSARNPILESWEYDILVNALPGHMGYNILQHAIELGKDVVDISFMPEDPTSLKKLAEKSGSRAVVDFGVAPGMCGFLLGYEHSIDPNIDSVEIAVGGMPAHLEYPYYYKAPFSPKDVIEEYTRPARMRIKGKDIIRNPITGQKYVEGYNDPLVAFNTDGLRTLLNSFPNIPNMVEKTIRHENHYQFMKLLQKGGFFDKKVLDNTVQTMLPYWQMDEDVRDFLLMTVTIGRKDGSTIYTLEDYWNNGVSAMARTTGYACNAVVHELAQGVMTEFKPGVYLPEDLGKNGHIYLSVMDYLEQKGVEYKREEYESK